MSPKTYILDVGQQANSDCPVVLPMALIWEDVCLVIAEEPTSSPRAPLPRRGPAVVFTTGRGPTVVFTTRWLLERPVEQWRPGVRIQPKKCSRQFIFKGNGAWLQGVSGHPWL